MLKEELEYLKDNPQGYWFKAKLYGWGWTPVTWQGWVVLAIYLGLVLMLTRVIPREASTNDALFNFFLPLGLFTAILILICYLKGEKPRWQWGPPKEK